LPMREATRVTLIGSPASITENAPLRPPLSQSAMALFGWILPAEAFSGRYAPTSPCHFSRRACPVSGSGWSLRFTCGWVESWLTASGIRQWWKIPGHFPSSAFDLADFEKRFRPPSTADTKHLKIDSRMIHVKACQADSFVAIRRIGGTRGWYYANWLWQLRGWMDKLVGGVGMRRGRRDPDSLRVGDIVDCWRVGAIEPDRFLRLVAEMRLPGRALLSLK
jgi:hypothetical protein